MDEKMYSQVVKSMDYCIKTWDPRSTGTLEEPHHNTYDIEFWVLTNVYGFLSGH